MKKIFLICSFFIFNIFNSISQENSILNGIWQGTDRLILFENQNNDEENGAIETVSKTEPKFDFSVVLRVFYGWYDDRAAENESFSEIKTRDKNDAESRKPEDISIKCHTIFENESKTAGVYELELIYPGAVYTTGKIARRESVFVPIAVIQDKMYLNFLVKDKDSDFWKCASNADGITISKPRIKKEVRSFFINKTSDEEGNEYEDIYHLRYWKSEMDYSDSKATFSDGKRTFEVSKYLKIGTDVYQCTTGRSTKIRNIEKAPSMPLDSVFDSDNTICAFGRPYLVKVPSKSTKDDLLLIVAENNKRRKDPPKPLFPPSEIDFHWKEISELEKYNPFTWNRRNIDLGK